MVVSYREGGKIELWYFHFEKVEAQVVVVSFSDGEAIVVVDSTFCYHKVVTVCCF